MEMLKPVTGAILFAFIFSAVNGASFPSSFIRNDDRGKLRLLDDRHLHHPNSFLNGLDPNLEKSIIERISVPSYLESFLTLVRSQPLETIREKLFLGVNSTDCEGHLLEWLVRILPNATNLFSEQEKWVLQMVDSWGKVPEGALSGHINAFGDFDECVGIKAKEIALLNPIRRNISKSFEGKYCLSFLVDFNTLMGPGSSDSTTGNPALEWDTMGNRAGMAVKKAVSVQEFFKIFTTPGTIPFFPSTAVCMPNSCSQEDIQMVLINGLLFTYTLMGLDPTKSLYPVAVACAEQKQPPLKGDDIFMIVLLSGIAVVSLTAGIIDYWLSRDKKNGRPQQRGKALQYFMAFSLYTNIKKWMSTRRGSEDMGCIHGMRFLSTAWVILGHTYAASITIPYFNMIDVKKIYEDWPLLLIINGTFSVDTFFVMSGMLATYGILKTLDKTKGKLNIFMFYVHRYLRLTPTYAILVGILATIVIYLGSGPFWNLYVPMHVDSCKNSWWTNLLYINNIYSGKGDETCHGETWYIANDMQFYILSPFIVYPLWKWERTGVILLTLYTILSVIAPVLMVEYKDAPPAAAMTRPLTEGFVQVYHRPWSRIQTYFVGMWLGWIVFKTRGKSLKLPGIAVALGWIVSTGMALAVIFGIHRWFDPIYEIPKVSGYFYAGLSRFSFGLSVAWVIFACLKGYGGIVNRFLCWKPFMPLGRLTFCVYLCSYYLQMIFHTRTTVPIKYDTYNMINFYFAHMVMSFFVGFLLTMLFESPFIVLQKLLFEGDGSRSANRPKLREEAKTVEDPTKRHGVFYENTDAVLNGQPVAIDMDDRAKTS